MRIATPIYYWGMSLDTVKYQEMQSLHIAENKVQIIIPLREQPYSRKHSAFLDDGLESG